MEPISSILKNFQQKATNPFLGTFILVWLYDHWKLIYSIFTFDKNNTRDQKIQIITEYAERINLYNLFGILGITTIAFLGGFIVLSVARGVTDFFSLTINPWILKINQKSQIVPTKLHNELKINRDSLILEIEQLKNRINTINAQNMGLEKKNSELQNEIRKQTNIIENLKSDTNINELWAKKEIREMRQNKPEAYTELLLGIFNYTQTKHHNSISTSVKESHETYFAEKGYIRLNLNSNGNKYIFTETGKMIIKELKNESDVFKQKN